MLLFTQTMVRELSKKPLNVFRVPNGYEAIEENAFQQIQYIEEIILPSSMKQLLHGAFNGCKNLRKATLGGNVTFIGYSCFNACTSLCEVIGAENVERISDRAFCNCHNLTHFNCAATFVAFRAFDSCRLLTVFKVSASAVTLDGYVFNNCVNLQTVDVPLLHVGYGCFQGCTMLSTVTFSPDATTVSEMAFAESGLKCVDLQNITELKRSCFMNCTKMETFVFAGTIIGACSFSGCMALKAAKTNTVLIAKSKAFQRCHSLTDITMLNATSIGDSCFEFCAFLSSANLHAALDLGPRAFRGCKNLLHVSIPNVLHICESTFVGVASLQYVNAGSVTTIGTLAFSRCSLLTFPRMPSLHTIGVAAFKAALKPNERVVTDAKHVLDSAFMESNARSVILRQATTIGNGCFRNMALLTSFVAPDTVNSMGDFLFAGTNLNELIIAENNNLQAFDTRLFMPHLGKSTPSGVRASVPEQVRCTLNAPLRLPHKMKSFYYFWSLQLQRKHPYWISENGHSVVKLMYLHFFLQSMPIEMCTLVLTFVKVSKLGQQ